MANALHYRMDNGNKNKYVYFVNRHKGKGTVENNK